MIVYQSGYCGPGRDGNKWALRISQSSTITGASLSDCLMPYPGHSLGESYLFAEMQSTYSTAPANWAIKYSDLDLDDAMAPRQVNWLVERINGGKWFK